MRPALLLGSAFLPASVLEPLAIALQQRGLSAAVAPTADAPRATDLIAGHRRAVERTRPSVLVVHSNAGNYVPALRDLVEAGAVIFMDAALPPLQGGQWPVVPPALGEQLLPRAEDGLLPPWTSWWPDDVTRALFPTPEVFERTVGATPRVPAEYLAEQLTTPPGWAEHLACGYLAFGDAYAQERLIARDAGWPTETLALGHLGMLKDPEATAGAVFALLERLD